jgi:DNA-binding NarL/FixJ family response regulator
MSAKVGIRRAMREQDTATLIVARPGPLRDGVEALLASVPRIRVTGKVGSIESALGEAAAHSIDLLLVDGSFPEEEIRRLLARCLAAADGVRAIVIANTARQAQRAQGLEVDAVFVTGRPAHQFVGMVEGLLQE